MRLFRTLIILTLITAFCVIVLGAYVRLSDAGLGCPDWPGCYGQLVVPETVEQIPEHYVDTEGARDLDISKAWKEMIHRYLASGLGLLILILAFMAWRNRDDPAQPVLLPFILVGMVIFQGMLGMWTVTLLLKPLVVTAHLLGGVTTLLLLFWLFLKTDKAQPVATMHAEIGMVIFQGMLGMWTVTLLLKPLVVTAHLLGGVTTLLLLFWLFLKTGKAQPVATMHAESRAIYPIAIIAVIVVYAQIFLGGWTSTNYAAMICPDFPTCQNRWWPAMDFKEGFTLWRGLGVDYEYGVLKTAARTAIHFSHRIGALITFFTLILLSMLAMQSQLARVRSAGRIVLVALLLQISLGITNIVKGLPLEVAVAHNGGAALLLLSVGLLLYRVKESRTN